MTVDYKTYSNQKSAFLKKHGKDGWNVDTSSMDQYGVYYKVYMCEDGAQWHERMAPVWRTAEAEVEVEGVKIKMTQDIKLFETEFWNTESPLDVKKYYEKY